MGYSRTKNVIVNSAARLLQRLSSILVQFVLRSVFIHVLGNEYTGVSGLFTDILNVLSLMEVGLDTSMVYALYKPLAEKNDKRIIALLSFYKKAFMIIGVAVLVLGISLTPFLHYIVKDVPSIHEDIRVVFAFYVITSAASYFFIYRTVLLNADQKSRFISKWRTVILLLECVIEVVCVLIFKSFTIYLVLHLIATIINNLVVSRISTKAYPQYFASIHNDSLSKEECGLILKNLFCLTAYYFAGVVINSTDSVFISAFIGTVDVAIIGNFTLIINSIRTLISHIVEAAKPSIGNLAVTTNRDRQEQIFQRMNMLLCILGTICCACFCSLLNSFVGEIWLDSSYKIEPIVIAVMSLNFYIAIMVLPVESFRTANGLFVQGWPRPIIMSILNIILDFIMVKRWGIVGILLATTISRVLTQVWYDPYIVYKMVFQKSPSGFYLNYILRMIMAFFVCIITVFVTNWIHIGNVYFSLLCKLVSTIILAGLIISLLLWKNNDYRYLLLLIKNKIIKQKSSTA